MPALVCVYGNYRRVDDDWINGVPTELSLFINYLKKYKVD